MKRIIVFLVSLFISVNVQAEAMLQYFNTSWAEIAAKLPELAETGYDSLWLPPPTKAGSSFSVGYDLFDPLDLGSKDQRGSTYTKYGTEAELIMLIETAHRFGIRVYFDNIMNHRGFDTPGYTVDTPLDLYPGMRPEDFHLKLMPDGTYRKWYNTSDWGNVWEVQNRGLSDLIDIATETGTWNKNHGPSEGWWTQKVKFLRHPDNPEFYCYDANGNYVGFGYENGLTVEYLAANEEYYSEYVEDYLNRAVRWLMDRTKCDGLRLDAVKHVPYDFFGASYGTDRDLSDYGYVGQAQRQFNISRGFADINHRDSVFNTDIGRDDAMMFGEHLGEPPPYGDYINAGMRLVDNILKSNLDNRIGNNLTGFDGQGSGGFGSDVAVMHSQSHDNGWSTDRHIQHAFYFTRAGLPLIYTDGNYHAGVLTNSGGEFPRIANSAFLGQWSDSRIPNLVKIHNNFARGSQKGIWSDNDYVAYERIDRRYGASSDATGVTMITMINGNRWNGRSAPITSSFPTDAYLFQYVTGPNGSGQVGFYKYANELRNVIVPPSSYYTFSYRTPERPSVNTGYNAINIRENGTNVSYIRVKRKDGTNGDAAFNPYGLPDTNTLDYTYETDIPIVRSGQNLSFFVQLDGSAENVLLKLDGGVDVNSQMGLGSMTDIKRDYPPGTDDMFLGYEQMKFDYRARDKFAAANVNRNIIGSQGAETYIATKGVRRVNYNNGNGPNAFFTTTDYIYHDPNVIADGRRQFTNTASGTTIRIKTGEYYNGAKLFVYYTIDGSSFPEGYGGVATTSTTRLVEATRDGVGPNDINGKPTYWWTAQVPWPTSQLRYKIGGTHLDTLSLFPSSGNMVSIKSKMVSQFSVSNFNATTVENYVHNDFASKRVGLEEGYHVLRARAFLKAPGFTPYYNTFTQVFYYDSKPPTGQILYPRPGETLTSQNYEFVIKTDSTVKEVFYNIRDTNALNDDAATREDNGNGVLVNPDGSKGSLAWAQVPKVDVNSRYEKEWRFIYKNIPSFGTAAIRIIMVEDSMNSDVVSLNDAAVKNTATINFSCSTRGSQ